MGITEERIKRITEQAAAMKKIGKMAVDVSGELDALVSDNAAMEAEIQGLNEANDSLRERLNRGENHEAYMKLPLDADGVPIRIGDEMWLQLNDGGEPLKRTVVGYRASASMDLAYFIGLPDKQGASESCVAYLWSHRKPEPADSWEKLEEDAMQHACSYFDIGSDNASCDDCPHGSRQTGRACWQNARRDMIARAKKLAGIDEEAE